MTDVAPPTIDANGVGRLTIANSEWLDRRRVLSFAAAIGPDDPTYLADEGTDAPLVHPGIAFALQFNAQRRLGVTIGNEAAWLGAVHAETDLRIVRPFRTGQVVTTQGQVVARRQARSGVLNVERYRMRDEQDRPIAELDFGLMLRGVALSGGAREIDPPPPRPALTGSAAPVLLREMDVPRALLHSYTAGSGIYAAIHTDRAVARQVGFPDIILQGSATKSIALSTIIGACFDNDPHRVTRLYGQLRATIPAETRIRIEALGTVEDAAERHVFFQVLNAAGEAAVARGFVSGRLRSEAR
jgi:acyl dehydratase